jgi:malonyl-CoA/methylmalonyl-CoA synthetase
VGSAGRVDGIRLIERAADHGPAPAISSGGVQCSYARLLDMSARVAATLLDAAPDLREGRVAFLIPGSAEYPAVQWGVWRAGGVAVPLSVAGAQPELEHILRDAEVGVALAPRRLVARIEPLCRRLGTRLVSVEAAVEAEPAALPRVATDRRAMILYTSGTTSRPKGVVTTHANIEAQIVSLVEAWGWRADDRIPLFLPLHHVHGIVNVLSCALWAGAYVEAFESFDRDAILGRVGEKAYTVFMAVPTVYVKLIQALESATPQERRRWAQGFGSMRLMVSGSAALPASLHQQWTELTGQRLLERYGMTEIGMGLSNPLRGERRPGFVGGPLPGVEVRLVAESGDVIGGENEPGEIQVRGPAVFEEYWRKPDATKTSFVNGWFRTGDVAVLEGGSYRILGRLSVDIIKSGGHKLSALEIEDALRQHPAVGDCAVVGVADATWGEVVAVAAVTRAGRDLDLASLQAWARERLSPEKIPRRLRVVTDFPRNAMGKVVKPAVRRLFER